MCRVSLAHHSDAIMRAMASQITGVSIVCSTVGSGADQRKYQSSASLAFVREIHRWLVNSPQKNSNAENVSIWWRHHESKSSLRTPFLRKYMLEFYIMPRPLKTESCHYGSFSVTGGKRGGRYYSSRCHQLRQSWHYDNSWLSMKLKRYMFHSLGREEHPHLPW